MDVVDGGHTLAEEQQGGRYRRNISQYAEEHSEDRFRVFVVQVLTRLDVCNDLRHPFVMILRRHGPFRVIAEQGDGGVVELVLSLRPRLKYELSMVSRRARGVQVVIFDTKAPEPPVEAVVGRIVSQTMIENRCFPLSVVGQVVPAS